MIGESLIYFSFFDGGEGCSSLTQMKSEVDPISNCESIGRVWQSHPLRLHITLGRSQPDI